MVCDRCKMVVKSMLIDFGLHPIHIELGEIELQEKNISIITEKLKKKLQSLGFELLDDKKTKTIEKIKNRIIDLVHNKNNNLQVTLSEYLTQELFQDYSTLSKLFSEVEGITIEKYYIFQKPKK